MGSELVLSAKLHTLLRQTSLICRKTDKAFNSPLEEEAEEEEKHKGMVAKTDGQKPPLCLIIGSTKWLSLSHWLTHYLLLLHSGFCFILFSAQSKINLFCNYSSVKYNLASNLIIPGPGTGTMHFLQMYTPCWRKPCVLFNLCDYIFGNTIWLLTENTHTHNVVPKRLYCLVVWCEMWSCSVVYNVKQNMVQLWIHRPLRLTHHHPPIHSTMGVFCWFVSAPVVPTIV